jgi:hypothetical protein
LRGTTTVGAWRRGSGRGSAKVGTGCAAMPGDEPARGSEAAPGGPCGSVNGCISGAVMPPRGARGTCESWGACCCWEGGGAMKGRPMGMVFCAIRWFCGCAWPCWTCWRCCGTG